MDTANTPSKMTTLEKPHSSEISKPNVSKENSLVAVNLPVHLKPSHSEGPFLISDIQLCDEVISNLWKAMKITYGQKWTDNFGPICYEDGRITETMAFWAQSLSRVPLKCIERGILKCTQERPSPFPPTLPEFYALCERKPWE